MPFRTAEDRCGGWPRSCYVSFAIVACSSVTRLLDGELAHRARETACEVVAELAARAPDERASLGGVAGQAVLLAHAGQVLGDERLVERAGELLDAAVGAVAQGSPGPSLWTGLGGVRWAIGHLAAGAESDEACATLDDAIATVAAHVDSYDLISGLVGLGVATLGGLDGDGARRVALRVLERLEALATEDAGALVWHTAPELLPDWQRALCPGGYVNLGLAHGMPAIVGLGARWIERGFETARVTRLVEGAVTWMLRTFPQREGARFPTWHVPGEDRKRARLAWCYGDPGVAVTLLAAARATGHDGLMTEALDLAHQLAQRTFEESGVVDTAFCHGAAGVAHIFHRMYRMSGDELLADAARAWIERLLTMRMPGQPIAGFPAWRVPDGTGQWTPDASLIAGAGGVALVLLAAISDDEPGWDEVFLT